MTAATETGVGVKMEDGETGNDGDLTEELMICHVISEITVREKCTVIKI